MRDTASLSSDSTTMVGYLLGVTNELESKGVSASHILRSAGVFNHLTNDPLNRFSSLLLPEILRLGAEATGDAYFGLHAMRGIRAPYLHSLGLGLLASESIHSFCQRLSKFFPLISGSGKLTLEERADAFRLITTISGPMSVHAQDSWLSLIFELMCQVGGRRIPLLGVDLMHSTSTRSADLYESWFDAPVRFGSSECALGISRQIMSQPLRTGCEELASVQDANSMSYLVRLNSSDMVTQMQLAIMQCLKDTDGVSLQSIVKRTGLRNRQIHHALAARDTSYQEVLDKTRMQLAKLKLDDPELQVSQVAYMVGFTDSANFSRAFKRWTGQSPMQYRKSASLRRF